MLSKLILSSIFATLLINSIDCQQMIQMLTSASNRNSQTSLNPQPSASQQSSQSQPQGLTLEQQQQLLQQLAALTAQQQRQQQQQQPQQQPPQQQPSQQYPAQQFFDPNQQPQFFGPQGGQAPPQQFFAPQQFVVQPQPQQQPPPQQPQSSNAPAINWGKCPQLEPSDKEKMTKAQVITKCLENTPLPANITRESVEVHREQIAACALQNEGWFTSNGGYDFNKAENEIKNKKLTKGIEDQVINYHKQCKDEAIEKFPSNKSTIIAQIQLYQACMDYFISDVCGIEVNEPEAPQFA